MPDKKGALKQYGESCLRVAELLKNGARLTLDEQTFIENHLVLVHLAIAEHKSRDRHRRPQESGA
jgi:hypothetical protein